MEYRPDNTIKKEFAEGVPGHVLKAKYFYFDDLRLSDSDLTIACGGHEHCASDFSIDRKMFPFYVIIFTVGGKGIFKIKQTNYPLSYGSLLAFSPETPYQLTADPKSPMEQFFLLFKGSLANQLLEKSKIEPKGITKVSNPEATLSNFKQILQVGLNRTKYAHQICCNYLRAILLEQADDRHDKFTESTSYENFLRCKNHIENNFIRISSSNQIADECNLNIRYIARLFRMYNEIRPYEYLMNLKMNKAANLLITTNFNVNQIAKMTGFEDAYNFSRIFKKRFEVSPTEYRKAFL